MSTEIRLMKCKTRLCNCEEVQQISCLTCGMEDYTEDDWDWDWRDDQRLEKSLEEMDMCTISGHNVSFKTIITSGLNINNEWVISGHDTNIF